jgi:hypothetical protein
MTAATATTIDLNVALLESVYTKRRYIRWQVLELHSKALQTIYVINIA